LSSTHASQRDTLRVKQKRRAIQKVVAELDVTRFKFLDESSVNTGLPGGTGAPLGARGVHVIFFPLYSSDFNRLN
jgi:hypothetical protein